MPKNKESMSDDNNELKELKQEILDHPLSIEEKLNIISGESSMSSKEIEKLLHDELENEDKMNDTNFNNEDFEYEPMKKSNDIEEEIINKENTLDKKMYNNKLNLVIESKNKKLTKTLDKNKDYNMSNFFDIVISGFIEDSPVKNSNLKIFK